MISALCGHVAGVSTSSEGFEAQFTNARGQSNVPVILVLKPTSAQRGE